ncbi:MAG: hypothetical protein WKF77_30000 [Planctomycetaceae bacterium]
MGASSGDTALCWQVADGWQNPGQLWGYWVVEERWLIIARLARLEVFAADEIAIVHVMNRKVRQTRSGKRSSTPKQFAPLFDRMGISAEI